jgi:hypothetical protein
MFNRKNTLPNISKINNKKNIQQIWDGAVHIELDKC